MGISRALKVTMAAIFAVTLGVASTSWACTDSAYLTVNPGSGTANSTVTVNGGRFIDGPVEIRWNNSSGPVIGRASGPTFSITVQIPAADPGVYTIKALAYEPSGVGVVGQGQAAFQVTSAADSTSANSSSNGSTSGSVNGGSTSTAPSGSSGTTGTAAAPADDRREVAPAEAGTATSADPQPAGDSSSSVSPGTATAAQASVAQGRSSFSNPPAAASSPRSGQPDAATAAGPSTSPAPPPTTTTDAAEEAPSASARTTASDLWSGFGSTSGPALRGPSLLEAPAKPRESSHLALGVALLSAGTVAMIAGFGTITTRRRRTAVHGDTR